MGVQAKSPNPSSSQETHTETFTRSASSFPLKSQIKVIFEKKINANKQDPSVGKNIQYSSPDRYQDIDFKHSISDYKNSGIRLRLNSCYCIIAEHYTVKVMKLEILKLLL